MHLRSPFFLLPKRAAQSLQQLFLGLIALSLASASLSAAQPFESIWYTPGSGDSQLQEARDHIEMITVIAPQAYHASEAGEVTGAVSDSLLELAAATHTKVMPLILNRGFNQDIVHTLLNDPVARATCVRQMVDIGTKHGFWGWQFDFENIHIDDRDALTVFFEEAAKALHAAGMILSIAVVPTDGTDGNTAFSRFMRENWRGSFDMAKLAAAGDFISLMTYSQHGGAATPGPVGGLPWMKDMLDYALSEGVPESKISLGIPTYSGYWYSHFSDAKGAAVAGREIGYDRVTELLESPGISTQWLDEQGVSYAFWEVSGLFEWLFIEDHLSFRSKMEFYDAAPGLRGISVWVLGAEDPLVWEELSPYVDR